MATVEERKAKQEAAWQKRFNGKGGSDGWGVHGSTYGLRNTTNDAGLKSGGNSSLGIPRPDRVKGK